MQYNDIGTTLNTLAREHGWTVDVIVHLIKSVLAEV